MPKSTRDIPSEDIQIPENTDPPKMAPESPLDDLAIERARQRYAVQQKRDQLREWFIYQAPPGVYDLYLEERTQILKDLEDRQSVAKKILVFLMAMLITFAVLQCFYPELTK